MKKAIIYCFGLLCAVTALAQPTSDSLLIRYRQMALNYNDDLKAAARNIEASIELERAARADLSPKISAGGEFQYTGNPLELTADLPGVGPLAFQGEEMKYGLSATLLQPIYTGGRIIESIRLAQSQQLLAELQEELLRTSVCFQVDVQYWNTVARFELMTVATDFRNSAELLTHIVRERVEAGLTDRQDLLTAEVKLNEAEYRLLQIQSEFDMGRMALNSLIGVPLEEQTPVGNQVLQVISGAEAIHNPTQRPEIRMAEERIEMGKTQLRLNDAQYKPQLHIGATGSYFSPGYDFRSGLSPNYAVFTQLSVPIFEGGKRKREKRASEHHIGMASDNLHKIETAVELETRKAGVALSQAMHRSELASTSLGKAQENEQLATGKYEEGMVSITDVINAQQYRQTAEINHVTAKAAAQTHYAELLKAANGYE